MSSAKSAEALLGPDLWALACAAGGPPVEVVDLTSLPSGRSPRASFRLVFADGSVRKGRRMVDAERARRVCALRDLVHARHVPALLGMREAAVLTEWCDGEPPGPDPHTLHTAGALLGSLHATPLPAKLVEEYGFPCDRWARRLEKNLDTLSRLGALTHARAAQILGAATSAAPADAPRGLVHCDFCPENLILTAAGALVMIDDENMTVDALPFDLARTWYRWPLDLESTGPFWSGYRTACDPTPFLEHTVFWMIQVLSEAAAFRVAGGTPAADVPLKALADVVSKALQKGMHS